LTGQRLITLAMYVLRRGRLDEALALREQAVPILEANPEPQSSSFVPLFDGYYALGRQDRKAAAVHFAMAADYVRALGPDGAPEVFAECARAFVLLGNREEAETYRDLEGSTDSVESAVFAKNVGGLLEPNAARAINLLADAIAEFERLEMRSYAARAMVDLGRAMVHAGQDPRDVLEHARATLIECDAQLFVFEVDEVLGETR
jgi:tetratricopeptide (TPR) repeat protein